MSRLSLSSSLLSFHVAVLTASVVCAADLDRAVKDVPQARTELYNSFDAEKIGLGYVSRFEKNAEFNAVSNFKFTPPGRWFKTFRIKGNISADSVSDVLDSVQRDLKQLTAKSGVTVTTTTGSVDERPISLLKALCPTYAVAISSIQGRHISYKDEEAHGDIDLFAFQFIDGDGGDLQWCVLCAVHEPVVAN